MIDKYFCFQMKDFTILRIKRRVDESPLESMLVAKQDKKLKTDSTTRIFRLAVSDESSNVQLLDKDTHRADKEKERG